MRYIPDNSRRMWVVIGLYAAFGALWVPLFEAASFGHWVGLLLLALFAPCAMIAVLTGWHTREAHTQALQLIAVAFIPSLAASAWACIGITDPEEPDPSGLKVILGAFASTCASSVILLILCTLMCVPCRLVFNRIRSFYTPDMCESCGYNLTGNVSGRCPECGTIVRQSSDRAARDSSPPLEAERSRNGAPHST